MTVAITKATDHLVVKRALPQLTWPTPAPIPYGVALSPSQLDARAIVNEWSERVPTGVKTPTALSRYLVHAARDEPAREVPGRETMAASDGEAAPQPGGVGALSRRKL